VNRNKFVAGLTAVLILFCFLYSCTKIKGTDIGSDLLPVVDNISTFDTTLEIVTENFLFGDSAIPRTAKTTAGQAPEMLLGYISNDPQFGKTTSTLFYEMAPVFYPYPYEVKDSLYLDSVVLCLRWTGTTLGDTNLIRRSMYSDLTHCLMATRLIQLLPRYLIHSSWEQNHLLPVS
jgi:hypothetical protein